MPLPPPIKPTLTAASTPKPPIARPPIKMPTVTSASPASRHTPKTFNIITWTGAKEGEKIILYGNSGMGKTTLATMAPSPVFIGLDDGGRKIVNPKTGENVKAIPGVESFQDLRDALHQNGLIEPGQTLVIDTVTRAEGLGELHTLATVKTEKGETPENLEAYGYGKGYKHLMDTMRLLISDLEPHVRRGVHVLLLAQQGQATVSNLEGVDYLQDGPKLCARKDQNIRTEFVEWVDHVFRIGHPSLEVVKDNKKNVKGKVKGTMERVIYTQPELYYMAKNRSNGKWPPVVSFENPADDSLWAYVFHGATV